MNMNIYDVTKHRWNAIPLAIIISCMMLTSSSYAAQTSTVTHALGALSGKNEDAKIYAMQVIVLDEKNFGDITGIIPVMKRALQDDSIKVRMQAFELLAGTILSAGDRRRIAEELKPLVPQLEALLDDSEERVRSAAAGTLAYTNGFSSLAEKRLLAMTESTSEDEVLRASQALLEKGRDKAAILGAMTRLTMKADRQMQTIGEDGKSRLEAQ